MNQLQTLQLLQ